MEKRPLIHMNSCQFIRQTHARVLHIKYRHDFYVRVRANCCPKGKSQENVKEGRVRERKITDGRRQLMRDQRIPLGLATGSSWKSEELIKADPDVEPEAPQTLTHAVPGRRGCGDGWRWKHAGLCVPRGKFWTHSARDQGSELPSSSEIKPG